MKFWDTSALVPLIIDEPSTKHVRQLLRQDPDVVVWMMTSVELLSAIARLGRATSELGDLLSGVRLDAIERSRGWTAVTHAEGVRRRAERLVGIHSLAAADAMQLAAALVAASDKPETLAFVTLDKVLARAAQLEGFRVVGAT